MCLYNGRAARTTLQSESEGEGEGCGKRAGGQTDRHGGGGRGRREGDNLTLRRSDTTTLRFETNWHGGTELDYWVDLRRCNLALKGMLSRLVSPL